MLRRKGWPGLGLAKAKTEVCLFLPVPCMAGMGRSMPVPAGIVRASGRYTKLGTIALAVRNEFGGLTTYEI